MDFTPPARITLANSSIIDTLNPADSFTLAMDEEIRQDGLAGSYGCFALELDNQPNIDILESRIHAFCEQFPVSVASLQQVGRKFHWCKSQKNPTPLFHHTCPSDENEMAFQQRMIEQIINDCQPRETISPIEFHLINSGHIHIFFMRWIHPFCDARGAEIILHYLCTEQAEKRQSFGKPETLPLVNQQLAKFRWWQKISLLFKGKRYIDKLDELESIQTFPNTAPNREKKLNYSIQRLDSEQTQQVLAHARTHVGLTGTSLYYIGCLMRALHRFNPDNTGQAYCTPYAFNLRKQRALTPVTGNHICALFAQAPKAIVKDRQQLFAHLKKQNTNVIRQQQDYAFLPLMWAGSWLSLKEYGKTLRLSHGRDNERSSFWFSDVGKLDSSLFNVPGANVQQVFHICQVTTPPGFAFLSCIFNDQLTISYNFIEPMISKTDMQKLHDIMLSELLETKLDD